MWTALHAAVIALVAGTARTAAVATAPAAHTDASGHQTSGLSSSLNPNCSCAQFCDRRCETTNAGRPENITMYRLTPYNVTGLGEKDTGDAAGDLGFFLISLHKLATCTPEQANTNDCFLALRPTIRQFFVETNGKYGPYMRCNPLQFPGNTDMVHVDTRAWGCFPWHGHPPRPWVPVNRSTSCPDMAYCPALMNHSVGRDPAMHHTFDPNNPNLATFFGGSWYSVPSQAECPEGVAPGESCAWRLQPGKEGKTANASCVADRVMAPIEANGKACYSKCPQPLDRKSECYFSCLEPAVFGSKQNGIMPIDKFEVINAWTQAFTSDTPSDGGCPRVL